MKINTIVKCSSICDSWVGDGKWDVRLECVLDCGTIENFTVRTSEERFYPGKHYRVNVEISDCPPEEVPAPVADEGIDLSKV